MRNGVAEVECLRRYGRLPAGTRGSIPFVMQEAGGDSDDTDGKYRLEVTIRIEGGPDPIIVVHPIRWGRKKRQSFRIARGAELVAFAGDVWDYSLLSVRHTLEGQKNRSGHPRFSVLSVAWEQLSAEGEETGKKTGRENRRKRE